MAQNLPPPAGFHFANIPPQQPSELPFPNQEINNEQEKREYNFEAEENLKKKKKIVPSLNLGSIKN